MHIMPSRRFVPCSGFSLVELSIVLVILGLLVGGVLSGQALIRAAELRTVTTDYNKYIAAMNTFKDKYFALVGDMTNATSFFGTHPDCGGSNISGSCNGDGDGRITFFVSGAAEPSDAWYDMLAAGLIEGHLKDGPGTRSGMPARFGGGGWTLDVTEGFNTNTCNNSEFGRKDIYSKGNMQTLALSTNYCSTAEGVMKAEEAWNIDTKIDDGKADNGRLLVINGASYSTGCIDSPPSNAGGTITGGNFALSDTSKSCRLFFKL